MFDSPAAISDFLGALSCVDEGARAAAEQRQKILTKPQGSLGRLEELAIFLAGWHGTQPRAERVQILLFAGNHGVTRQGISPFPAEVTVQMVANFERGGAAINALADTFGLNLSVHPLSLDNPTADISVEPAMDEAGALEAWNAGANAVDSNADIVAFGEMGIGNTTIAAALCAVSLGGAGIEWAGRGTGLDQAGVQHKAAIVDRALARHGNGSPVAFDILRSLGGRELCAIAGGICAARRYRIPVLLDGFVVCAAAAPLFAQEPAILQHCLAGHCSAEQGHRRLLKTFDLLPLLNLEMRLGEGSGAAVAVAILRAAVATHNRMATFESAGVSERTE